MATQTKRAIYCTVFFKNNYCYLKVKNNKFDATYQIKNEQICKQILKCYSTSRKDTFKEHSAFVA